MSPKENTKKRQQNRINRKTDRKLNSSWRKDNYRTDIKILIINKCCSEKFRKNLILYVIIPHPNFFLTELFSHKKRIPNP